MNLNKYQMKEHVSLKNMNTYQIDTQTRYLFEPKNQEELMLFLKEAKENHIPYFVLGNGSNVILSDTEYPGVVIKLTHFNQVKYEKNFVTVGSGVKINQLSFDIIDHGLSGLEWASGIPGTIGGSIYGNAEAYKVSTFQYLKTVTFLTKDFQLVTKKKEEISHGYRTTWFKENEFSIILAATFQFPYGKKEESLALIKDRYERRRKTQPLDLPSAGSVFRNPSLENPAGKIIEELNFKGVKIGGAMVSPKHANFIVNYQNATGKDIKDLIKLIKEKVKKERQIDLVLEQEIKSW